MQEKLMKSPVDKSLLIQFTEGEARSSKVTPQDYSGQLETGERTTISKKLRKKHISQKSMRLKNMKTLLAYDKIWYPINFLI
jgi:hypothetical protein